MDTVPTPQEAMDAAFDNYFMLADVLNSDLNALLDSESEDQHWRRNFIRLSNVLIEGHIHCLTEMCLIYPEVSKNERAVLRSGQNSSSNDRIKFTLREAFKLFQLTPAPDFSGKEWNRARYVFKKRNLLMHPKMASDLEVSDELWPTIYEDVTWLIEQIFSFSELLQQKHSNEKV